MVPHLQMLSNPNILLFILNNFVHFIHSVINHVDNKISIWDARNSQLLGQLTGHTDLILSLDMISLKDVTAVAADESSDAIVTVSDDGTAKVFLINAMNLLSGRQ